MWEIPHSSRLLLCCKYFLWARSWRLVSRLNEDYFTFPSRCCWPKRYLRRELTASRKICNSLKITDKNNPALSSVSPKTSLFSGGAKSRSWKRFWLTGRVDRGKERFLKSKHAAVTGILTSNSYRCTNSRQPTSRAPLKTSAVISWQRTSVENAGSFRQHRELRFR